MIISPIKSLISDVLGNDVYDSKKGELNYSRKILMLILPCAVIHQ